MKDHELDRILSTQEDLVPSSGFVKNVMDAVRQEAAAPPPIPFPWKRALTGLILCVLAVAAACVTVALRPGPQRVYQAPGPSFWTGLWSNLTTLLNAANVGGLGWVVLALLLTFASVMLPLRLIGRRI